MKDKLEKICIWLNENYGQDSENYGKDEVIKYDEHIAISFWACGAIVCIESLLYFIEEDDGYWFINECERDYAVQCTFSIGWAESFAEALKRLVNYVNKNGEPVYYTGTERICHYSL